MLDQEENNNDVGRTSRFSIVNIILFVFGVVWISIVIVLLRPYISDKLGSGLFAIPLLIGLVPLFIGLLQMITGYKVSALNNKWESLPKLLQNGVYFGSLAIIALSIFIYLKFLR